MATRWREHEERSGQSSLYRGYNVRFQKRSRSTGKTPDFFGIRKGNSRDRIVGDAKWCLQSKKRHIDQVAGYKKRPFCAGRGVLHYPANAEIADRLRGYGRSKNVTIVRTRVFKVKERRSGILGPLKKKKYKR